MWSTWICSVVRPTLAHSLGGIIVKEALAIASREYQAYPMISAFTDSIFFIAVPHNGSQHASCGVFASRIARAFTFQPDNSYLTSLSPGSDYSKELNTRFQTLLLRYKFYTWIEGREVPYVGLIVPEDSGKLGLPAPHEVCRITERNHRNICQFCGENDLEWLELSAHISKAAFDATTSFNYSPALDRSKDLLEVKQYSAPYTVDVLEATDEAQSIAEAMNMFQNSTGLLEKETGAGLASEAALSLAKLLLAVISPILHVLSLSPLTAALGSLLLSTILVGLPSKNELLEKARQGREAEETIMEVEDWAIDMLNGHQRAALLASYHLQQVIDRIELQGIHDEHALPLFTARLLQQELQTLVMRNTQNIHERLIEYQKAEQFVKRIQDVKKEVEGKNKKETYMHLVEEQYKTQEGGYCPEECVIL
ncbi:uncharacterized protein FOBCDRAFT_204657 [Fusarium oxysporum Fo47]|uniref:uncharacterized protein n=1 Tax=Fusarium oxysporum Fo47 TaxID=660027 RepID=UPI002869D65C|nr:uncharacterized protein FOBCDRAFT_204657 [Fusarium oxysporum Fo47]WJG35905.1 hypothetical protein FOBCDRAFT_204657 [Fusarium oxysporum Fo47]